MTDSISLAFMILAVVLAVLAGLWFGTVLGESTHGKQKDGKPGPRRTFTQALQNAAGKTAVRVWQWQRARAKKAKQTGEQDG